MTDPVHKPVVTSFFHDDTNTITHVVVDPATKKAAIIDPVLDFDASSGARRTDSVDEVIAFTRAEGLDVVYVLETHVHADHLTAAPHVKAETGAEVAIGAHIGTVQETWNSIFNYKEGLETSPHIFDRLFVDGETFHIGELPARVLYTPGHTAVDVTYLIGDAAFVGDTMFMPDYGTARCDFPGGDARTLYRSIQRLLDLPDETRVFVCHDYLPKDGRKEHRWQTTIGEARRNVMIAGVSEDDFVATREARDANLSVPALLYPSLQVNIRGGDMPPAEDNGRRYIKLPLD